MKSDGFNLSLKQLICNIIDPLEQEIATKLVYQKTQYHSVKLIPFHDEWAIDPLFTPVQAALIKLTTIRFAINALRKSLKSVAALRVIMYIDRVYHDLFKSLIINGCERAPPYIKRRFITAGTIDVNDTISLADEINQSVLL